MKRRLHRTFGHIGLVEAARKLGASRITLWRALTGRVKTRDESLVRRFYALMATTAGVMPDGFPLWPGAVLRLENRQLEAEICERFPSSVRPAEGGGLLVVGPLYCSASNLVPLGPVTPAEALSAS